MADYIEYLKPGASAAAVPIRDPNAIQRDGDTMKADLSMGNFRLTDLGDPTSDKDAANKAYVDGFMPKTGGTMTGDIGMGGKAVTDLASPVNDTDAVNKQYVSDNFAKKGWTEIGSWISGGSLSASFTDYDELCFVCDFANDTYVSRGGATIYIPTICFGTNPGVMYFGTAMNLTSRFMIKLTTTTASTYTVTYGDSAVTDYKIYCYGR